MQQKRNKMNSTTKFLLFSFTIAVISCGEVKQSNEEAKTESTKTTLDDIQLNNNGVYINHNICGDGDITLLFIHGWCIDQSYWSNQIDSFCSDYRVVTIDLPGYGKSGTNREIWTIEEYGKDIRAVIKQLKLTNVILIGHSMGGDIILEAANNNNNEEEIIALIGIDNFKVVGLEYDDQIQAEIVNFVDKLKQNFREIAPAYAKGALFHPTTNSMVKNRVMNDFKSADSTIAISNLEALFEYSTKEAEQLSILKQKIYLINSDATSTDIEGLEATGVTFEVVYINSTGHYPMIEKPNEFNQLLKQTISKIETVHNKK